MPYFTYQYLGQTCDVPEAAEHDGHVHKHDHIADNYSSNGRLAFSFDFVLY